SAGSAAAGVVKVGGWCVQVAWWLVAAWRNSAAMREAPHGRQQATIEALFRDAQCEYLKGHWVEAEALALRLLKGHPGDVEARLLLAAVYRRSRRVAEATSQLVELGQMPGAGRWAFEMGRERELLEELSAARNEGGASK